MQLLNEDVYCNYLMKIYIVIVTKRHSRYLILKNVAVFELYLTLILILAYFIIQKQNKIKG